MGGNGAGCDGAELISALLACLVAKTEASVGRIVWRPRPGSLCRTTTTTRTGGESIKSLESRRCTPQLIALPVREFDQHAGIDEWLKRPVGVLAGDPQLLGDERRIDYGMTEKKIRDLPCGGPPAHLDTFVPAGPDAAEVSDQLASVADSRQ